MSAGSDQRIRKVIIVGGGTAGWLAAAYLNRALASDVKITAIESSAIPPVGVGEATIPTLRHTFGFLGMEESEWMPKCNATYKMAIRFDGWLHGPNANGRDSFYHPFHKRPEQLIQPYEAPYFPELGRGFSRIHHWLKQHLDGKAEPYAYACYPTPALCDANKAPSSSDHPDVGVTSAYHFDASLLAVYLRDLAISRGVEHVVDHVASVELNDRGYVDHLKTEGGRKLDGDLFIDCSGFRGLIINKALGQQFISDKPALFCDSAVAIPAHNNPERDGIRPYTIATALSAGWVWDVPLFHRNGCGYVYASDFLSKEDAERELRAHLGSRAEGQPARHIRMRVGRNENYWAKNCVSMGLASCFLEPLESTSIFLTEYQLAMLLTLFPDRSFDEGRIRRFNQVIHERYEEIRDFIVLHYVLTERDDSDFWKAVRSDTQVPDGLQEKLEFFQHNLPVLDQLRTPVFRDMNYTAILAGMNRLPESPYPVLEQIDPANGERLLAEVKAEAAKLLEVLPSHYEQLKRTHGSSA